MRTNVRFMHEKVYTNEKVLCKPSELLVVLLNLVFRSVISKNTLMFFLFSNFAMREVEIVHSFYNNVTYI